jgi:hypothetical protein
MLSTTAMHRWYGTEVVSASLWGKKTPKHTQSTRQEHMTCKTVSSFHRWAFDEYEDTVAAIGSGANYRFLWKRELLQGVERGRLSVDAHVSTTGWCLVAHFLSAAPNTDFGPGDPLDRLFSHKPCLRKVWACLLISTDEDDYLPVPKLFECEHMWEDLEVVQEALERRGQDFEEFDFPYSHRRRRRPWRTAIEQFPVPPIDLRSRVRGELERRFRLRYSEHRKTWISAVVRSTHLCMQQFVRTLSPTSDL